MTISNRFPYFPLVIFVCFFLHANLKDKNAGLTSAKDFSVVTISLNISIYCYWLIQDAREGV